MSQQDMSMYTAHVPYTLKRSESLFDQLTWVTHNGTKTVRDTV